MIKQTSFPWQTQVARDSKTVLLITSLAHRRFVDDAIQIVGLPFGSRIWLRYRKQYVSSTALSTLCAANSGATVNVLIALVGESSDGARFEPLRVGTVASAGRTGEIVNIEVELREFAANSEHVWPQIASMTESLPVSPLNKPTGPALYVQHLASCPSNVLVDESVEAWERTADAFLAIDLGKRVPFLYMMRSDSKAFKRYRKNGELVLESGSILTWAVHTKCAPLPNNIVNPLGEVIFEVSCPAMRMITTRRIRADSRRDVRNLRLSCDSTFRTVPGHLSIKVITFAADENEDARAQTRDPISLSRYDIPIRAGRRLPTVACVAAALAASGALWDGKEVYNWNGITAVAAGVLVFLSLKLGFRSSAS